MPLRDTVINDVLLEFQRRGFLLLKVDSVLQKALAMTFQAAKSFFSAPIATKMASILPADTGYRPFGIEHSNSPAFPDQMESFSVSIGTLEAAKSLKFAEARLLHTGMLATLSAIEPIAEAVAAQVAQELSQYHLQCRGAFRSWSFLQLNYSRPSEVREEFINELHEDGCLLTVANTTSPGLEVQRPDGSFIQVATAPDEVIVMPGEILWLLSGGSIRPLYHRVRTAPAYQERFSLLFFGDIDPRLCKPWIVNNTNQNVDIADRVLKNPGRYGLQEWSL